MLRDMVRTLFPQLALFMFNYVPVCILEPVREFYGMYVFPWEERALIVNGGVIWAVSKIRMVFRLAIVLMRQRKSYRIRARDKPCPLAVPYKTL